MEGRRSRSFSVPWHHAPGSTIRRPSNAQPSQLHVGEQLHVGPQLQAGPQLQRSSEWHDAAGWAAGFWQPQVHSEPVQAAHAQTFDRVDMRSSLLVC